MSSRALLLSSILSLCALLGCTSQSAAPKAPHRIPTQLQGESSSVPEPQVQTKSVAAVRLPTTAQPQVNLAPTEQQAVKAVPATLTGPQVLSLKVSTQTVAATEAKTQVHRIDTMDVYALAPSSYLLAHGHMLKASGYLRTERLAQLSPYIAHAAAVTGLEPELIAAVIIVESGAVRDAVSNKGALGLMQLMPETARELKLDEPFDPKANITAGSTYLKQQITRFKRVDLALAAYNAGPQAVLRAQGIPAYPETQNFVTKVLSTYTRLKHQ